MSATPWDEIAGGGAARKKALLAHFGSAKAVSRAAVPELMAVDGINEGLAQKIYDHLKGEEGCEMTRATEGHDREYYFGY